MRRRKKNWIPWKYYIHNVSKNRDKTAKKPKSSFEYDHCWGECIDDGDASSTKKMMKGKMKMKYEKFQRKVPTDRSDYLLPYS